EKTYEKIVGCSHTEKELVEAHEKLKKMGIDLLSQCDDYEVCEFEPEFVEKLKSLGIESDSFLWGEEWCKIYMELAKRMIPDMEYKIDNKFPRINIGGYGLFT
ncbi:hypothetical protein EBU94_05740, partial [bacterium]|nr:hypothetical protein [bacterium]